MKSFFVCVIYIYDHLVRFGVCMLVFWLMIAFLFGFHFITLLKHIFANWWANYFFCGNQQHVINTAQVILNPEYSFLSEGLNVRVVCYCLRSGCPCLSFSPTAVSLSPALRRHHLSCWLFMAKYPRMHLVQQLKPAALMSWHIYALKPGWMAFKAWQCAGVACPQTEAIPASLLFLSVGFMGFSYPRITLFERGHASGFSAPLFFFCGHWQRRYAGTCSLVVSLTVCLCCFWQLAVEFGFFFWIVLLK